MEHDYCKQYLKDIMRRVRKAFSPETIKASWGYKYSDERIIEFHINKCIEIPEGFYWSGRGCCIWMAKALGWEAYFKSIE